MGNDTASAFRVGVMWALNNAGVMFAILLSTQMDHQKWLHAGKVQQKAAPLSKEMWWMAFRDTLKNQLLFLPFFLLPVYFLYTPRQEYGIYTLLSLGFMILFNDTGYYWTHRLFHQPWFYQRFHKKDRYDTGGWRRHHLFTAPEGVAAVYMTPVEYYVNQVMPATMGICITGVPFPVAAIYYMLSGFGGTMSHSGYWMAEFHDEHHRSFNCNFGVNGSFWDRLMGTEAAPVKGRTPIHVPAPPSLRKYVTSKSSFIGFVLRQLVPFDDKAT